jgi:hypothetical protein
MGLNTAGKRWILALFVLGNGAIAQAVTINSTFDPTVTALGPAVSAQWISAWNFAAGQFQAQYSDPITINITLKAGGGLGGSSTNLQFIGGTNGYGAMKAALLADASTANDATANANLPAVDPTGGARLFIASFANAKALGLRAANDPATDGVVTLGSGNTFTFDPNNRAVAGAYDFIGVAEHEISEVMGRLGILGQTLGTGRNLDDPIDLFGYSTPGVLNLNQNQQGVYFSIDGGVTSLRVFNNHSNGGDDKDWASNQVPAADSFNAFGTLGAKEDMSPVDQQLMDVIGYNLVPEPSGWLLMCFGTLALLIASRARRHRALA